VTIQSIQSTVQPGDTWPQVADPYATLQILIDKGVFATIAPTELEALKDQLRSEEPSGYLKDAAVSLVKRFQEESGLVGTLGGFVEDQTAELLNQQLKKHGSIETGTDFVMRGTVKDTHKRPPCGLVVIAVGRDLRRWQEQGRTETDPEGKFEIRYRYEPLREAEGVMQAL
jgi:hypothetical protein